MKRWTGTAIGVAAALVITLVGCTGGGGSPTADDTAQQNNPAAPTVTDPVCGMKLTKDQIAATAMHDGNAYHFCMASEKELFVANPEKYIAAGDGGGCAHGGMGAGMACCADSAACPHNDQCTGDPATCPNHTGGGGMEGCGHGDGDGGHHGGDDGDGHGGHHGGDGNGGGMHGGH